MLLSRLIVVVGLTLNIFGSNLQADAVDTSIFIIRSKLTDKEVSLNAISESEIDFIQNKVASEELVSIFIRALTNEVRKYTVDDANRENALPKNQIIKMVKYIQNRITTGHLVEYRTLHDAIETHTKIFRFYDNFLKGALGAIDSRLAAFQGYTPNKLSQAIKGAEGYVALPNGIAIPKDLAEKIALLETQEADAARARQEASKNSESAEYSGELEIPLKEIDREKILTDEEITELREKLDARIPGLAEVKGALIDLEEEKSEFGLTKQQKPKSLWFLPLDTGNVESALRNYVDIVNFQGASENNNMIFTMESMGDQFARSKVKGSGPGYVGSEDVQAFVRWAVKNSGGRYLMPVGMDAEINSLYYDQVKDLFDLVESRAEYEEKIPGGVLSEAEEKEYEAQRLRILSESSDPRITLYMFEQIASSEKPLKNAIFLNPFYEEGQLYAGYRSPHKSVLLVKLDGWSTENISDPLVPLLTSGKFELANSPIGVSELKVQIPIVVISSHAADRIASRNPDGTRFLDPLSTERLRARASKLGSNWEELEQAILAKNSLPQNQGKDGKRIPEAFLDAIPKSNWIVPMPLTEEEIKQTVKVDLDKLADKYLSSAGLKRTLNFIWDESVVEWIAKYKNLPEDQTKQISGKINDLIVSTIKNARKTFLNIAPTKRAKPLAVLVRATKDQNNIYSLEFYTSFHKPKPTKLGTQVVLRTTADQPPGYMSLEQLRKIRSIPDELKRTVKGADQFIDKISPGVVRWLENAYSPADEKNPAQNALTILAAGLSSGGKTFLGQELARLALPEGNGAVLEVFLNRIQTKTAFDEFFYGSVRHDGTVQESEFMKYHRMFNGAFMIRLEEFTNAPQEIQIMLYDFLREPVVRNFADGKPRYMGKIMLYATANRTEEFYKNIPKDIPQWQLFMARMAVYEELMSNFDMIFESLTGKMTEATVLRFQHVGHSGPLDLKSIREIIWLELEKNLKGIRNNRGTWSYDLQFASLEDYMRMTQIIELEGYEVVKNAASVTSYLRDLITRLKDNLESKELAPGSRVILRVPSQEEVRKIKQIALDKKDGKNVPRTFIPITMETSAGKWAYQLPTKPLVEHERENMEYSLHTAAHEIGHMHVRERLLGKFTAPGYVTTLPEVVQIGDEWIRALGVAYSSSHLQSVDSLNYVLREMAVLMGGQEAERIVTVHNTHSMGKSNDTERATELAYQAVLKYGLVSAWGVANLSQHKLGELSEADKVKVSKIVNDLLLKARYLADMVIQAELKTVFIPLVNQLAEKRILTSAEVKKFYATRPSPQDYETIELKTAAIKAFERESLAKEKKSELRISNNLEMRKDLGLVESLMLVEEVIERKVAEMTSKAVLPENISVLPVALQTQRSSPLTCSALFH